MLAAVRTDINAKWVDSRDRTLTMPSDSNTDGNPGANDATESDSNRAKRLVREVTDNDPKTVDPAEAVDLLDNPDAAVRSDTAEAIARLGAQQPNRIRPFASQLTAYIPDDDPHVQAYILSALAAIANVAPEEVEPVTDDLIDLLTDNDPTVREWTALTLAYIGAASPEAIRPAVPDLIDLLEDERGPIRKNVCLALIAAGAQSAHPALQELKDDPDPAVREVVQQVFGSD